MAGRHNKPPSPYLFHPDALFADHHATVSIIMRAGENAQRPEPRNRPHVLIGRA
jgi:hypothetical protein